MKKLTVIILTIGTILLSGCGANQKQVSSENKNLSQEKVVVNSGEKVKNLIKKNKLKDKNKQEKQAVKTDKKTKEISKFKSIKYSDFLKCIDEDDIKCVEKYIKQGGDINEIIAGDWKTPLMHASEKGYKDIVKLLLDNKADLTIKYKGWKTALIFAIAGGYKDIVKLYLKNGEDPDLQYKTGIDGLIKYANKIGQDDIANILGKYEIYIEKKGITVEYKIQELTDYNHCLISKEDFENMQKAVDKLFSGANNYNRISDFLKYKDLCLPKYKLIGTIKRGDLDTITVESCHDGKPYTLKNFKKGDKKFEYNIAYGYGNVCNVKNNEYSDDEYSDDEYSDEPDYSSIYYQVNFYKDGKKLNEINPKKQLFSPYEENIIYKQGDKVCKIGRRICLKLEKNNRISIIIVYESGNNTTWKINQGKYKGYKYIMINGNEVLDNSSLDYSYTYFPENKDLFVYNYGRDMGIRTDLLIKSINLDNNFASKKYITNNRYLKYIKKGYKLCFLGKLYKNFNNSFIDERHINGVFNDSYLKGEIYTGYIDNLGFNKIFCKNKIKIDTTNIDTNFGTNLPLDDEGADAVVSIFKISVGESLLKKLGIDTTKSEQDITNYKNLNNLFIKLNIYNIYYKSHNLSKLPLIYKYNAKENKLNLDKSKIKKVILKLKPEHYPFGEERYLYEVWINGKKISAEKYFKKNY